MNKEKLDRDDMISEIIKHELEITLAITGGHRPQVDDEYQERRERVSYLRELLKSENK